MKGVCLFSMLTTSSCLSPEAQQQLAETGQQVVDTVSTVATATGHPEVAIALETLAAAGAAAFAGFKWWKGQVNLKHVITAVEAAKNTLPAESRSEMVRTLKEVTPNSVRKVVDRIREDIVVK